MLQADSEHLDYKYRADAEYLSPEDSLVHSVVNAAQVKNSSSFVVTATQLAGNTAQGAGGAIFATSQAGVYLLCGSSNLADTGQSSTQCCLQVCKLGIGCDATMFLHDPEAFKGISLLLNGIWATQHLALRQSVFGRHTPCAACATPPLSPNPPPIPAVPVHRPFHMRCCRLSYAW